MDSNIKSKKQVEELAQHWLLPMEVVEVQGLEDLKEVPHVQLSIGYIWKRSLSRDTYLQSTQSSCENSDINTKASKHGGQA